MQYKIIVDKQSRINPSDEKREYIIDIEELRTNGEISDSLVITNEEDYVMRRLQLSEYHVLIELEEPVKETLEDINIELFEGDNYIYIIDMTGNKFYAEYLVKNDFIANFATKVELRTAINQTNEKVEILASKKLDKDEFATYLEVNPEAVKVAWNKIAEFIQIMIHNNKASFAILNENKEVLTTFDKEGQHFFDSDSKVFAEMGIKTVDNNNYIAFSVPGNYGEDISDGMAWGITIDSDNKFFPVLFLRDFSVGNENAGNYGGELELAGCDLVLKGLETGIKAGDVKIYGNMLNGISIVDTVTGTVFLDITPENSSLGVTEDIITILGKISFFKNASGSNSFALINDSGEKLIVITDEGSITSESIFTGSVSCTDISCIRGSGEITCNQLNCYDNIYCNNGVQPFSLAEKKKNIKKYNNSAIKEIKNTDIYYYNYKDDKKGTKIRVGAIIGDKYNCSKEIIGTEGRGIDQYSMISIAYKAIQEQQETIETQAKEIDNLKERLARLEEIINERQ